MNLARLFRPLHLATAAAVILLAGAAGYARAQDEALLVEMDQSRLMKLPEGVATLVIGNPSIADGTLQGGGLMVLTGKSYGRTNLIALDHDGVVLVERELAVVRRTAGNNVVTVYRGPGGGRQTLNCDPRCEPSVTLGDNSEIFDGAIKQINDRNGLAGQR